MRHVALLVIVGLVGYGTTAAAENAADRWQDLAGIRHAVTAYLRATVATGDGDLRVDVSTLDPRLHLAACTQALAVALAPGSRDTGSVTVDVRCHGAEPWQIFVPARVGRHVKMLVATRPLARNETIRGDDVTLADRDVADITGDYFTTAEAAVGKRLKRAVGPGIALTRAMVQNQLVIHRGDTVTILAEGRGVSVRVAGEALGDAAAGDTVRVRNNQTRRMIEATAVAAGTVKVMM